MKSVLVRTPTDPALRTGLLTQPSFLISFSASDAAARPLLCTPPAAPYATDPATAYLNDGANVPELIKLQSDLIVSAFACGLSRVATLGLGVGGLRFKFLDGAATRADLHLMGHEFDYPGQTGVFIYLSRVFSRLGPAASPKN